MRRLLEFRRSPNCIKIRIALNLKGLEFETEEMSSDDRHPVIRAANWPLVPVLIDGEVTMRDSEAILHYLECNYPEPSLSLHEREAVIEAATVRRDFIQDTRPVARAAFRYMNVPEQERDADRLAELNRLANEAIAPLNERLETRPYLFDDHLTMDDIIVACSMIALRVPATFREQSPLWRFFHGYFSIDPAHSRILRWYDEIIAHDGLTA